MAKDPTAAYRAQQGLAPVTHSYDPVVVDWTRRAAAATGADPVALLATALQESGARRGAVGDKASGYASYGPWQLREKVGALGNRPPSWANSYEAALNRATEFARLGVHGGKGAAAVQRPADRALYAQGVDKYLDEARAILAKNGSVPAAPKSSPPSITPTSSDALPHQDELGMAMIQSILDQNAQIAHVPSIRLPIPDVLPAEQPANATPTPRQQAAKTLRPTGRVIDTPKPRIIGAPHQGTHTIGNWQSDNAIDIAIPVGTPIRAATDGVIGSRIGSLGSNNPRFAGLRVNLQGQGQDFYYAHLSRLAVKAGQRVKKGQIIGYSGSANGVAHLHLGVRKGDPRRYA